MIFYPSHKHSFSLKELSNSPYVQFHSNLNPADYRRLHIDSIQLTNSFLKHLSVILNEFHGVDLPTRYWSIRLYPWLPTYIASILDKLSFLSKTPSSSVKALDTSRYPPRYTTYTRFSYSEQARWENMMHQIP